jgi:hypothetical protein
MCARFYLNGEHDAILQWPFKYKVTLCLYDQTGAQRHIIDSFRPDITSNSFQRPRSEMNIASGIPKFCPLVAMELYYNSYVRDDTMVIKVMVDFGNIPRVLLPDVLSINSCLPAYVQQDAIREMEIRYQRQRLNRDTEAMHNNYQSAESSQQAP